MGLLPQSTNAERQYQLLAAKSLASCDPFHPRRAPTTMILIGQYDSPFVRRVAIALRLYGLPFEHRPWSTFGDADQIAPFNPLRRVPTLLLDSGEALIESTAILDTLDELVGPEKTMIAARGPERRQALKICALATGLGDKGVSLLYERMLRKQQSKLWVERCEAQIGGVLDVLETERAALSSPFWFGGRIGHADIAVACVLRFTGEAHPGLFGEARHPALAAHAARCEALPSFGEFVQKLSPPSG
jgi:glutathione S-transferase